MIRAETKRRPSHDSAGHNYFEQRRRARARMGRASQRGATYLSMFYTYFSSEAVNGPTGWLKAVSVHSGACGLVPDSCNLSTMLTLDSD